MITTEMVKLMGCPTSPADPLELEIEQKLGDAVITGQLVCPARNEAYPIAGGVPDLIPYELLDSAEWKMWKDHLDGYDERQKTRSMQPDTTINKLSRVSRPKKPFAAFTGINEGTVLDIGCGPGKFRHSFDEERVTYCGIDPLVLPGVDGFRYVRGLAEYLPFRDDTFTDVVILSAMDHFKDLDVFFTEVIRALKPDGTLHIMQSVHEVRGPVSAGKMVAHYIKDMIEDRATKVTNTDAPKHIYEFSSSSLMETVNKYFDVVAVDHYSAKWYSPKKLFLSLSPRADVATATAPATSVAG